MLETDTDFQCDPYEFKLINVLMSILKEQILNFGAVKASMFKIPLYLYGCLKIYFFTGEVSLTSQI